MTGPTRTSNDRKRLLIVAATAMEVAALATALGEAAPEGGSRMRTWNHRRHDIDLLTTGVGMVATAARCSRALATTEYDVALNVGVCGSFDPALTPGAVVHVISDRIAELGAEDADRFLTIEELKLLDPSDGPFGGAELVNASPPAGAALARLPRARGITVNTVHGNARSIAAVRERFAPQVESMEGAAFMYSCLLRGIPFAQLRAVSNVVETRNRASWRLAEAIANVTSTALDVIGEL
jgi:futalosine hydrolase